VGANIIWGIRGGLFIAAILCSLAAIPLLLIFLLVLLTYASHWTGIATSFFVRETIGLGLHTLLVFPLYLIAGTVGGTIVGILRPLTQWRLGATFLGMVCGTIGYWCMGPVVAVFTELDVLSMEHLLVSLGLGSIVGGGAMFAEWKPPTSGTSDSDSGRHPA